MSFFYVLEYIHQFQENPFFFESWKITRACNFESSLLLTEDIFFYKCYWSLKRIFNLPLAVTHMWLYIVTIWPSTFSPSYQGKHWNSRLFLPQHHQDNQRHQTSEVACCTVDNVWYVHLHSWCRSLDNLSNHSMETNHHRFYPLYRRKLINNNKISSKK